MVKNAAKKSRWDGERSTWVGHDGKERAAKAARQG